MRTFLEGCCFGILTLIIFALVIGVVMGAAMFLLWGATYHGGATLLILFGIFIVACGIDAWWEERQEYKKYWRD